MATDRLPLDAKLWALISAGAFCLIIFAERAQERGLSVAGWVISWLEGTERTWRMLEKIAPRVFLFAVMAGFLGWALHSIAVVCGIRFGSRENRQNQLEVLEPEHIEIGPVEPWEDRLAHLAELRRQGDLLNRARQKPSESQRVDGPSASPH
jgi:hypothetical protein